MFAVIEALSSKAARASSNLPSRRNAVPSADSEVARIGWSSISRAIATDLRRSSTRSLGSITSVTAMFR